MEIYERIHSGVRRLMAFRYDNNRTKTTSARNGSPRTTRGAASNAMATMAPPPPPQYHTLSTPKTFDQVVTIPGTEETETSINFVSLTDLEIDVGRIQPGVGPLDVSGNTCYECTFMVDSESAILANVRKARLVFYLTQPANFAPAPVIIDSVGSITHHNASYARAATGRADAAGTAYGHDVASRQGGSSNNVISARIADAVEPNIVDPDDGRVYQCDIPLGINDTMVTEYHLWVEQETAPAAPARPSNPPLPSQRSVVQLTDTIRISPDLGGNRTQIDNTRLQTSPRARANTTSEVSNTNSSNRLTVLTQGRDPTAHLNNFYAQGPTGGRGPRGRPINYSLHGVGRNQVRKTSQKVIASSYKSVASSGRQNKTTQRIQTTYPTRAQEELAARVGARLRPTH